MIVLRLLRLLLPALIPSWRFFRAVAASPRIEVRAAGSADWREVAPRPDHLSLARMCRRMLWNPRWNEALYLVSLAERVVEQGSAHAMHELQQRVSKLRPNEQLELRLVFIDVQGGALMREVLYQSAPFGGPC
ncbi:hypothetical protein KO516_09365 [Citreicella sp. C3M06]|uniref:hypothetical protein n=1 Tax=Citreicella sp. C3M06 TaxID=2841564 RepID=UPI001C089D2F|nr:hypothetical protein [Citreicella sp. C3M06]MBU2961019.1 hypothetical protein [Citreicella sp. C3M06]